jgi:outer membrane protein TolC
VDSAKSVLDAATERQRKATDAVAAAQNALDAAKANAGVGFATTDAGKQAQGAVDAAKAELADAQAQQAAA